MTLTQIKPAGLSKPVDLADNEKIRLGTGNDLEIYHDGNNGNSHIKESGSGSLVLNADDLYLQNAAGTENLAVFIEDGAVELYYNNSKKFQTTSIGCGVTGNLTFADNGKAIFGAGDDLQIWHDATHSRLNSGTGMFNIQSDDFRVTDAANSLTAFKIDPDGATDLRYNGSVKLQTTSSGATVTGTCTATGFATNGGGVTLNGANYNAAWVRSADTMRFYDETKAGFGDADDLKIYHTTTGNSSYILNSTGNLNIASNNEVRIKGGSDVAEHMGRFIDNGAVELYYDASKKMATQSAGVTMEQSLYMANANASIFWGTSGGYGGQHGIGTAQLANYHVNGTNAGDMVIAAKNQQRILFATAPNNTGGISASGGQWRMAINSDTTIDMSSRIHAQSGINFGTDTADANSLDDYEEGTWTVGIDTGSNTSSLGYYVKIGKMVHIRGEISCDDTSSNTNVTVNGIPFQPLASSPGGATFEGSVRGYGAQDVSTNRFVTNCTTDSLNKVAFGTMAAQGQGWEMLKHNDLHTNNAIRFTVTYQVA